MDIIRLALGLSPRAPSPPARFPPGRDTLARPFAKTAQRLRNFPATPPLLPRSSASRLVVCLMLVPLMALATSATARAEGEDSAAVEKVTKLNKKAVDEY